MTLAITIPYTELLADLPGGLLAMFLVLFFILAVFIHFALSTLAMAGKAIVRRTRFTLDDRLLKALTKYIMPISILTALWMSLESTYPDILVEGYSEFNLYVIAMLMVLGFMLSSVADAILLWYGLQMRKDRKVRDSEVFPFVRNVVKVAIVLVFLVFVLQRLGFETGAIITGLGVGGLAVALALQDTLSNFFAGVHILVDKPFKEGDFLRLETGVEGSVKQIGWRTTRLVTTAENEIVVPNSKLAGSVLENYSSPDELTGMFYTVGVDYKEDVDHVQKVMVQTLKKVAKENPLMDEESIWVRFEKFGDFSLDFRFGYRIRGYTNRFAILNEVNRALFYSFKNEGISIPFPVRVVHNVDTGKKRK